MNVIIKARLGASTQVAQQQKCWTTRCLTKRKWKFDHWPSNSLTNVKKKQYWIIELDQSSRDCKLGHKTFDCTRSNFSPCRNTNTVSRWYAPTTLITIWPRLSNLENCANTYKCKRRKVGNRQLEGYSWVYLEMRAVPRKLKRATVLVVASQQLFVVYQNAHIFNTKSKRKVAWQSAETCSKTVFEVMMTLI